MIHNSTGYLETHASVMGCAAPIFFPRRYPHAQNAAAYIYCLENKNETAQPGESCAVSSSLGVSVNSGINHCQNPNDAMVKTAVPQSQWLAPTRAATVLLLAQHASKKTSNDSGVLRLLA